MRIAYLRAAFGRGLIMVGNTIQCVFHYSLVGVMLSATWISAHAEGSVPPVVTAVEYYSTQYCAETNCCPELEPGSNGIWGLVSGGVHTNPAEACAALATAYNNFQICRGNLPQVTGSRADGSACGLLFGTGEMSTHTRIYTTACPAHSTGNAEINPGLCICDKNYLPDSSDKNCVTDQETYTLTLTPASATIEPGKTYSFTATVTKQGGGAPSKSVPVSVKVEVDPTSGGHDHGETYAKRDKGTVSPATGTNSFPITFSSTEVSGTHTITATCDLCSNNTETATVNVKVEGLSQILGSVYYSLTEDGSTTVVGDNGNHLGNHYLTGDASIQLWRLAASFYNYQIRKGVAKPTLLHLNDASLKWGGLFDRDGDWDTPHVRHRKGVVIDIRANTTAGNIPESMFNDFEQLADETKLADGTTAANAELHCSRGRNPSVDNCVGDINRHYHVLLLGVDQ